MKLHFCTRQEETAKALRNGPLSEEMRAHVDACHDCAELMSLSQTFRQSRAEAMESARLDSPALLWWRAQLRQRYSTVERVTRPVVLAEKFALFSMVLAALGLAAWQSSAITDWMGSLLDDIQNSAMAVPSAGWMTAMIVAGASVLASFSGLAMYLFAKKE